MYKVGGLRLKYRRPYYKAFSKTLIFLNWNFVKNTVEHRYSDHGKYGSKSCNR